MAEDAGESKAAELLSRIQSTDDFYEILGVERDADDDTIKKAYRKAALRLHPDKCQLEGAKEAFQKVSTAFGCLSEADERAYYDRTGRERSAAAVGQHAADPDEIFRQFFGEDFDLNAGGGGVRFQTFGGGQGFTFVNLGGGGFPMAGGGAGTPGWRGGRGGADAAVAVGCDRRGAAAAAGGAGRGVAAVLGLRLVHRQPDLLLARCEHPPPRVAPLPHTPCPLVARSASSVPH